MFRRIPVESWPGLVLVASAVLAIIIANSAAAPAHTALLKTPVSVGFGDAAIIMPVSSWVKNAFMAVFFFFAGLELKREFLEGALSDARRAILPVAGAVGGMAAPALIYLAIAGTGEFKSGWAIPAATDIAFALGVLSLLGNRVPLALKAFLLAVAVVDDLGAILIVAFVYTEGVSMAWLAWAGAWTAVLAALNLMKIDRIGLYVLPALGLWVALQNSGVNPTIAGVILATAIPLKDKHGGSPLHDAEHVLRPWVLYGVMPIFALANAGVAFGDDLLASVTHPVALAVAAGLAIGKPVGILGITWLTALALRTPMPGRPVEVLGVGLIAGIGFTMSLFIGALAFADPALAAPVRIGVYAGSLTAAVIGIAILARALPATPAQVAGEEDETHPFIAAEREYEHRR